MVYWIVLEEPLHLKASRILQKPERSLVEVGTSMILEENLNFE